jgi:uncharacterized protein with PIN domain
MTSNSSKDKRKHHKKDEHLDDRLAKALSIVEGEIQSCADQAKAQAHKAVSDMHDELVVKADAGDWNDEAVLLNLRNAVAKFDQENFGKVRCPRCGSDALALSDSPADPATGQVAPGVVSHAGKVLRCNQCGYQPPA